MADCLQVALLLFTIEKSCCDERRLLSLMQQCRTIRFSMRGWSKNIVELCEFCPKRSFAQFTDETVSPHRTPASFPAAMPHKVEERERRNINWRIKDTRLPRFETPLDEICFAAAPQLSPTLLHLLAEVGYLKRAEPIIMIGNSGMG